MLLPPPMAFQFPPADKPGLKMVGRPFVIMCANTDISPQPPPSLYNISANEKTLKIILTFKIKKKVIITI